MEWEVALIKALIHTRNAVADYNPEFAVCDSTLTADQKRWARSIIQSAVESFDKNSAPKYIVETQGEDVLAGVICLTSSLSIDEKFFHDDKGRSIRVFIGCIFKRGSKQIPDLNLNRCADLFTKYLDNVWDRKSFFDAKSASDSDFEIASEINFGDSDFRSRLREYANNSIQKKTPDIPKRITNNQNKSIIPIIAIAGAIILAMILILTKR